MDWKLVASYFTVISTDIFYSVVKKVPTHEIPFIAMVAAENMSD